jgi:hypothetical protein
MTCAKLLDCAKGFKMSERREPLDCYVMKPNWSRRFTDYELVGMPCEWNDYECIHIKEVLPCNRCQDGVNKYLCKCSNNADQSAQIKALQEENEKLKSFTEQRKKENRSASTDLAIIMARKNGYDDAKAEIAALTEVVEKADETVRLILMQQENFAEDAWINTEKLCAEYLASRSGE